MSEKIGQIMKDAKKPDFVFMASGAWYQNVLDRDERLAFYKSQLESLEQASPPKKEVTYKWNRLNYSS